MGVGGEGTAWVGGWVAHAESKWISKESCSWNTTVPQEQNETKRQQKRKAFRAMRLFDLTPFMIHKHKLSDISCKKQASKQKHAIKIFLIVSKNSSFSSRFKLKDKIVQPFGTRVGFSYRTIQISFALHSLLEINQGYASFSASNCNGNTKVWLNDTHFRLFRLLGLFC